MQVSFARFKIPEEFRFVAAPKSERSRNLNRNFRWVPAFFLQLKPQLEVSQLKRLRKRPLRKLRSPKRDSEGLSDRPRHASQWGGRAKRPIRKVT